MHPTIKVNCGEEMIGKYMDLHDYAVKHSKTIQKIRADVKKVNVYTKSILDKNKRLYRGGSVDEVFKLERHHGKTGYHKRGIASMKGKDFTSTSVFPDIALEFSSHDFIPVDEGIVFEYDVSKMLDRDISVVEYDLRGRCMQYKNYRKMTSSGLWENLADITIQFILSRLRLI